VFLGEEYQQGLERAEGLFAAITEQGARLPSQRRFAARARSLEHGVQIPRGLLEDIRGLL